MSGLSISLYIIAVIANCVTAFFLYRIAKMRRTTGVFSPEYKLEIGRYKMAITVHKNDGIPAVLFVNDEIANNVLRNEKMLRMTLANFDIDGVPSVVHFTNVENIYRGAKK